MKLSSTSLGCNPTGFEVYRGRASSFRVVSRWDGRWNSTRRQQYPGGFSAPPRGEHYQKMFNKEAIRHEVYQLDLPKSEGATQKPPGTLNYYKRFAADTSPAFRLCFARSPIHVSTAGEFSPKGNRFESSAGLTVRRLESESKKRRVKAFRSVSFLPRHWF